MIVMQQCINKNVVGLKVSFCSFRGKRSKRGWHPSSICLQKAAGPTGKHANTSGNMWDPQPEAEAWSFLSSWFLGSFNQTSFSFHFRSCLLSETFHICQKRAPRWRAASSVSWLIWIPMSSTVLLTSSLSSARRTVGANMLHCACWEEMEHAFIYLFNF